MKIYSINDVLLLDVTVDDSSYRNRVIKGEHNLTLKYSHAEHIELPIGAYCTYQGERYTLENPESFKMKHSRNFEYTVTMEAYQAKAKIWKFRNTVDGRLKFPLTARPIEHLRMFVDNMNRRDTGWSIGGCIDDVEHLISYDHDFCWDALGKMATEFKTEFEIVGKRVSLGKVEYNKNNPLPLSYGKGKGFKSGIGRSNGSNTRPVEILYVQGGTQNIDRSKYGNGELLLPKGQAIAYDGEHFEGEAGFNAAAARRYVVDDQGLSVRRSDKSLTSLAEDSLDCTSIYPKRVGAVSNAVVVNAEKHFYDIIDDSIPEALNYEDCLIAGETMSIIFQSGMLAGRELEVKYHHKAKTVNGVQKAARRFEIVPQEIDGITMPNETFAPRTGDQYAVFKVMLPQAYICDNATKTGAEWDMLKAAVKHLFDNEEQKFTFTGELDGIWAAKDWENIGGRVVLGGYIRFSDERFQKEGVLLRITGIKDYINKPHSPVIEISNKTVSGGFTSDLKKLESGEVLMEEYHRDALQFTKRRFRDAKETIEMLEATLMENFTNSISPIAIQTMQMIVGDESLQFRFVNNRINPTAVNHTIRYDVATKQLKSDAGLIQHLTLGVKSISASHDVSEYRFWAMNAFTSARLDRASEKYYLYIKASKADDTAELTLSTRPIKMEEANGYYHFLVGMLGSEYEGERSFTPLYGFTEVLPGRITTDKIVSGDGTSYFDMLASALKLGDKLQYNINGDGLLRLRGTVIQSQSGDESPIGCFRGNYNASYTYYSGDEVTYLINGSYSTYRYINATPSTGHLPTETAYWAIVAQGQKGEKGQQGQKGIDGKDGKSGKNGDSVEYIYRCTEIGKAPNAPASVNADKNVPSGWTDAPSGVSDEYPFEYVSTRRQSDGVWGAWSTPTLWANHTVWNTNLLDQTEFESADKMSRWETRSLYHDGTTDNNVQHINPNGREGQHYYSDINVKRHSESPYKNVLRQILSSSDVKKMQPSTWYTLSFWERCGARNLEINKTSNADGFARQELYLFAGREYALYANGRIDAQAQADGKQLVVFLYNKDWTWAKSIKIKSLTDTTGSVKFSDVPADGEYILTVHMNDDSAPRTGKVTINWVRCVCESSIFNTFLYPSLIDTAKAFIDGKERINSVGTDLHIDYKPSEEWRRHVITFKTKDTIPTDDEQYLLLRLDPTPISGQENFVDLCMPKLERGKVATAYSPNANDMGADYQEYRFAKNGSTTQAPELTRDTPEPTGWTLTQPAVGDLEYLWATIAKKSADGTLLSPWSTPIRVSPYDGKDGLSPALVFCGVYDPAKTYYGNRYRVDACKFGNAYYVCRIDAGEVTGVEPTNTTKWNSFGASFESIATNLLLAEGANIAGWIFRDGKLYSQNGKAYLDGVTGDVNIQGKFLGIINATTGSFGKLVCINTAGKEVGGITFSSDASMLFDGDIYHNGSKNGRSLQFKTSDLFCRGSFGAYARTAIYVEDGYMSVLGISEKYKNRKIRLPQKNINGVTVFGIPLYYGAGYFFLGEPGMPLTWDSEIEAYGMPIDCVILKTNNDRGAAYAFDGEVGKIVHVVNISPSKDVGYSLGGGWQEKWTHHIAIWNGENFTYIVGGEHNSFICIGRDYLPASGFNASSRWLATTNRKENTMFGK